MRKLPRTASRSPLAIARAALTAFEASVPAFSHRNSPKTYTQPQLLTLLVLKSVFDLDYRGLCAMVEDWSDLREVLGLKSVPDDTTLVKASHRLLKKGASISSLISRSA